MLITYFEDGSVLKLAREVCLCYILVMSGQVRNISVSVVIPVYNEEASLQELYQEIIAAMDPTGWEYEMIFVDDGSTDGSLEILKQLSEQDKRVKVIVFARNFGQTAALDAGFHQALGDIVVPIDADLQNDPADIPKVVERLIQSGADVVSGYRIKRQDAFWTKTLPSKIANRIISKLTGVYIHDYGCTLKAYKRKVLQRFHLYGEMHRYIPAYIKWAGGRVEEIPVNHRPRKYGRSKYTLKKSVRVLLDLITLRFLLQYSTSPLYFIGRYGLLFITLSILSGSWSFIKRLIWGKPLYTDPFFILTFILFLAGVQIIVTGILAELLMRTYFESQNKRPYIIDRTINLQKRE